MTFCRCSDLWRKIYTSHFGSRWKPKSVGVVVPKAEPEEAGLGHWKKQYMWKMVGQEMNRWRSELRHLSADTGLRRRTQQVLR